MLPRHPQHPGQLRGADGSPRARHDLRPGGALRRARQSQRGRRLAKRLGEPRRVALRQHRVPERALVHAVGHDVGELELRAVRDHRRVHRAVRGDAEEGDARKLARQLRGAQRLLARRADVHQGDVHQLRAEEGGELVRRPRVGQPPDATRKRRARHRPGALARRERDDERRRRAGAGERRHPSAISARRLAALRFVLAPLHHLRRARQHLPRVLVREERQRVVVRQPLAGGDPFVPLRTRARGGRLHEEEMAGLVNEP